MLQALQKKGALNLGRPNRRTRGCVKAGRIGRVVAKKQTAKRVQGELPGVRSVEVIAGAMVRAANDRWACRGEREASVAVATVGPFCLIGHHVVVLAFCCSLLASG